MENKSQSKRIESIDILRGAIIIIMALDHSRDLFHKDGLAGNPLDPGTTTPILYFTRWITHFCAPTFVFLCGLSAWLQGRRKSKKELSLFLIKRGLWLIIADLLIMSFAFTADIHYSLFVLETLWSIGISMVILGLVIRLPFNVIFALGLIIVFGHNLIDFAERTADAVPIWWRLLHRTGMIPLWDGHILLVLYPFLAWTGLMFLGYCCGKLFTDMDFQQRKKVLLCTGIGAILFFIALRAANFYGDPSKWEHGETPMRTFYSFMNVQKYPPSLLFLCATIGGMMIALALIKNTQTRITKIISIYGRVPFFFFIVHFYLLHIGAIIFYLARGHSFSEGMKGLPGLPFKFAVPGEGFTLGESYIVWVAIIIIMYPLCKWFDQYKRNHREKKWLSYL